MGPLDSLIANLSRLPGLGKKSAVRMAFHLLKADRNYLGELGRQISTLRDHIVRCSVCGNYTEVEPCEICSDPTRDRTVICVVEQVQDLMNLQATGEYRGLFHVLHGVIAPLDGVGPAELGLDRLEKRLREGSVSEVILATNPTLEGDTTALYVHRMLSGSDVRVTRLASGLPVGGDLEYADRLTIARALKGRAGMEQEGRVSLAGRNTVRSLSRRWPVFVVLAAALFVFVVGNSLLESVGRGMEATYVKSLSGNASASADSSEPFTLTGNELPLIGEFSALPQLPDARHWIDRAKALGLNSIGQITTAGVLTWGGLRVPVIIFGVDAEQYFSFFPDLQPPQALPLGPWIMINQGVRAKLGQRFSKVRPGVPMNVSVFTDDDFAIREVEWAGTFRYPARDPLLDRIVLVDAATARALTGATGGVAKGGAGMTQGGIDDLFAAPADDVSSHSGYQLTDLEREFERPLAQELASADTWNFVLVRGEPALVERWRQEADAAPQVQGRDWRQTLGGNAMVVWLLQVLFSVGVGVIVLGGVLVSMNSLSLSVVEREKELATLRALGASRARVSLLVVIEALFLVMGAGLVGVCASGWAVVSLDRVSVANNPYLVALFGDSAISMEASPGVFATACGVIAATALIASLAPLSRALRVSPALAMERDS